MNKKNGLDAFQQQMVFFRREWALPSALAKRGGELSSVRKESVLVRALR